MFKLVVFLLLGAIMNVLVSYSCVAWSSPWPGGTAIELPVPGRSWPRKVPMNWPAPRGLFASSSLGHSVVFAHCDLQPAEQIEDPIRFYIQGLEQYGWPLRAIESEIRSIQGTIERSADAGAVADFIDFGKYPGRRVPLRPIWSGVVVNTISHAAILWLFSPGPFALRRFVRRKRGLCVKCSYDLRGNSGAGCPECGWQREAGS